MPNQQRDVALQTQNTPLDVQAIRQDFPILRRMRNGLPIAYLDSAATSQKPQSVIDAISYYYEHYNANVHRGVYEISEEATAKYEGARRKLASFIHAKSHREIIYTKGTTEGINLVAYAWGRKNIAKGDMIILTELEHHSNLVPWQILAEEKGARLEFIPVMDDGTLDISVLEYLLRDGPVKMVACNYISNALGTINPVKEIIAQAHAVGALVLLDGAQAAPLLPINVQDLGCDFFAFSGHKMLGPTGIGVLWGREDLLNAMPPFLGGGDMIREVHLRTSTYNDLPWKFEAGTPHMAGAIGLGAAVDYLRTIDRTAMLEHERSLVTYALETLGEIEGVTLYGPAPEYRAGVVSFTLEGVHPHDIATILDAEGVCVRAGHHCTQPLMERLGVVATARASFYLYNTKDEVDRLAVAVRHAQELFKG